MASSRFGVTLAAVLLFGGCASGRLKRENAMALAAADGRVLEGCYDCVLQARDAYERLDGSKYSQRDSLALRLFEAHLLLALRDKELQLDWSANFARASAVATRLPASIETDRVLRIAESVLPNGTGRGSDWPANLRSQESVIAAKIPDDVAWLNSAPLRPPVREYLALALDCFDIKVAVIRSAIGRLTSTPSRNPAHTARRIAGLAADSAEQRMRFFASAFNAAGQRANTRNFARAMELLDIAGRDSTLTEPVVKLRQAILAIR